MAWLRAAEGREWTDISQFRCGRNKTSTRQASWRGLAAAGRTLRPDRPRLAPGRLTARSFFPLNLSRATSRGLPEPTRRAPKTAVPNMEFPAADVQS